MTVLKRTRAAQWPLVQEFVFNYNDGTALLSALNSAPLDNTPRAAITDFGSKASPTGLLNGSTWTTSGAGPVYFDMFSLPLGAQVIGGDMQVEDAYVGPSTVTLTIGDSSGALYLAAQTLKAAALAANISSITNATSGDVTRMNVVATNTGVAIGQTVTISGIVPAAYNGTFIVVATNSTTDFTVVNPNLTSVLTYVSGTAGTYLAGRTALLIPTQVTAGSPSGSQHAPAGVDIRGTLTFGNSTAATAGRVRVKVMYTVDGRMNEVSPN